MPLSLGLACLLLTGCGGGGGGTAAAPCPFDASLARNDPACTNTLPSPNAGPPQSVAADQVVTLDGSGSTDSDGTITTFLWVQTSGPGVVLNDPGAAQTSFTAPRALTAQTLVFQLTVTDNNGSDQARSVSITVQAFPNSPPVASAGADQTAIAPDVVTLDGSDTDEVVEDP